MFVGDVFLLVFSLDDRASFEEVRALHAEIVAAKTALHRSKQKVCVPTVVCANKADLPSEQRAVSRTEVLRALGNGCALFETSAKDGVNLEQVFEALARRGGLPLETGPSQHRKVSMRSYQALRATRQAERGSKAAACEAPCGVLFPLARRPSFRHRPAAGPRAQSRQKTEQSAGQVSDSVKQLRLREREPEPLSTKNTGDIADTLKCVFQKQHISFFFIFWRWIRTICIHYMWPWSTKPAISSTCIFVPIAKIIILTKDHVP